MARLLLLRAADATPLLLYSAVQPNRWCPVFNATNGEQADLSFLSLVTLLLRLLLNFSSHLKHSELICTRGFWLCRLTDIHTLVIMICKLFGKVFLVFFWNWHFCLDSIPQDGLWKRKKNPSSACSAASLMNRIAKSYSWSNYPNYFQTTNWFAFCPGDGSDPGREGAISKPVV